MKNLSILVVTIVLLSACTEPKQVDHRAEMSARIDSLETKVMDAEGDVDSVLIDRMIHAWQDFNKAFPEDSMVVKNTFNLGVMYTNMPGKELYAVDQFRIVYDDYPDHPLAPQALYNMGIAFDLIGNKDLTVRTFQEFVNVYPQHEWADAAQEMIALNSDSLDLKSQVDQWLQQAK